MAMLVLSVLIALALAFGAVQEVVVRGIYNGETEPLIIGLLGTAVAVLVLWAIFALWKQKANAHTHAFAAAAATLAFHIYGALPPQRYVGFFALLLAVVLASMLLAAGLRTRKLATRHS